MSRKRTLSDFINSQDADTQLVQFSQEMPRGNRPPYVGDKRRSKSRSLVKSRPYKRYQSPAFNKVIVSQIVDYNGAFTADVVGGFGFSATRLWRNEVVDAYYPNDYVGVFDMCRIIKVEMFIFPACNSLGYGSNTVTTGARNIPYGYCALDYNDNANPATAAEIKQYSTCERFSLDKPYMRTFYPRLADASAIVNMGNDGRKMFVKTGSENVIWNGVKIYMDLDTQVFTYDVCRISFKVFMELRSSK